MILVIVTHCLVITFASGSVLTVLRIGESRYLKDELKLLKLSRIYDVYSR